MIKIEIDHQEDIAHVDAAFKMNSKEKSFDLNTMTDTELDEALKTVRGCVKELFPLVPPIVNQIFAKWTNCYASISHEVGFREAKGSIFKNSKTCHGNYDEVTDKNKAVSEALKSIIKELFE